MKKINVLTGTLRIHVPIDLGSTESLLDATAHIEQLRDIASEFGQVILETRLNRVAAPAPKPAAAEPVDDGPAFLKRRTAE